MFGRQLKEGSYVKLNLLKLKEKVDSNTLVNILEFDDKHKNIHKITKVYSKNLYTKDRTYRYELDNEYVFYKDELILGGE